MSADSIPMTADSATHPAPLALHGSCSSRPVFSRPRSSGLRLVPRGEVPRAGLAPEPTGPKAAYRGLYLLADTRGSGPQPPPPSALFYWTLWLCSVCLLLLATI
jgi:hypothetical protein